MELDAAKRKYYITGYIVFSLIIVSVVIWLFSHIIDLLLIIVASILMTYLLLPAVKFFETPTEITIPTKISLFRKEIKICQTEKKFTLRKKGTTRLVAVLLVYLILFLAFVMFMNYVIPRVSFEFGNLTKNIPEMMKKFQVQIDTFNAWLQPRLPESARDIVPRTMTKFSGEIEQYIYNIATYMLAVAHKVFSILLAIIAIPLFTFYILMDLETFKSTFKIMIPRQRRDEINGLLEEINQVLGRFVRGQILISIILGTTITIVLLILGVDYAFLLGMVSAMTNFIPYLGVIVTVVPAAILALSSKGFVVMLLTIAGMEMIHILESQFLSPAIMGDAVQVPPLVIILSMIIGGQIMGFLGILIAIPTAAIVRITINYYLRLQREKEACMHSQRVL